METGVIIAISITAIGIIPGVLAFYRQLKQDQYNKKKADAEVAEMLAQAAMTLVEPLKQRLEEVEMDLAEQKKVTTAQGGQLKEQDLRMIQLARMNLELCQGVRILIQQIESLGHEPKFRLKDEYCNENST